ncbi:MAG: hypothetical protein ACI88H_000214 [Cocleimonas sp.]|jgi:hypothetical protein
MPKPKASSTILGVHSNVAGDGVDLTGGHAWISVTRDGVTTAYGLWPDAHPRTIDNGDGTDIRVGLEGTKYPRASRFYRLNAGQSLKLGRALKKIVAWRYTNTCASWASELLNEVTGVNVDADDWGGFETPRELGKYILKLEANKGRTSRVAPAIPEAQSMSW